MSDGRPLVIDLFCGLGGWAEGFLIEGFRCIGFDIERHDYGAIVDHAFVNRETGELQVRVRPGGYPGQLVLQDVLTLHGSQFRDAAVIVASPPCQEYSYMAMPWSRAKAIAAGLRGLDDFPAGYRGSQTVEQLNALFDACFRIQREASEAAGHHIPLVVENVKGAQPWVGRAAWSFGSYYLWGDIPALMPPVLSRRMKCRVDCSPRNWSDRVARTPEEAHAMHFRLPEAQKVPGFNFHQHEKTGEPGGSFQSAAVKQYGSGPVWFDTGIASLPSKGPARKAASAQIAKIPFALANWIARCYDPRVVEEQRA